MLINPGGPGGSGFDYLPTWPASSAAAATGSTWSASTRAGSAGPTRSSASPTPTWTRASATSPTRSRDASFQGVVDADPDIADGCGTKYGDDLRLFSTEQAASDMDAIRAALGEEKLNYLGFSYGTLLGAVYAELFPTNIRAMVLDGAVDPQQARSRPPRARPWASSGRSTNFTAWCKANTAKCPIAPDPRGRGRRALDKARTNPVKSTDGRVATAGWVFYAVVASLYSQDAWPYLAQAIDDLRRRRRRARSSRWPTATPSATTTASTRNLFDANNAVNCTDSDNTRRSRRSATLQAQWRTKYPLFGGAARASAC